MGSHFDFRSNFDILQRDKDHPVRILQSVQFQIIRASWSDTVRNRETSRTDLGDFQQWNFFFDSDEFIKLCTILERRANDQEGSSNG